MSRARVLAEAIVRLQRDEHMPVADAKDHARRMTAKAARQFVLDMRRRSIGKAKRIARAHAVGSAAEPQARVDMQQALAALGQAVDTKAIGAGFVQGNAAAVLGAIDFSALKDGLQPVLALMLRAYQDAAMQSGGAIGTALKLPYDLNITNAKAVEYARIASGRLIQGITDETLAAVQSIIDKTIAMDLSRTDATRLIRNIVGLNDRQANAVERLRSDLTLEGELSSSGIDSKVKNYADRLRGERAQLIARQEIMTSARAGQRDVWDDAVDKGLLDTQTARKIWIVTDDDRLCELCESMDGQEAEIGEDFDGPEGPVGPEGVHVGCRCDEGLVFDA